MDLPTALTRLAEIGKLGHLMLVHNGISWQASHRVPGENGYRITHNADPVQALLEAVGPRHGQTWEDHFETLPDDILELI